MPHCIRLCVRFLSLAVHEHTGLAAEVRARFCRTVPGHKQPDHEYMLTDISTVKSSIPSSKGKHALALKYVQLQHLTGVSVHFVHNRIPARRSQRLHKIESKSMPYQSTCALLLRGCKCNSVDDPGSARSREAVEPVDREGPGQYEGINSAQAT